MPNFNAIISKITTFQTRFLLCYTYRWLLFLVNCSRLPQYLRLLRTSNPWLRPSKLHVHPFAKKTEVFNWRIRMKIAEKLCHYDSASCCAITSRFVAVSYLPLGLISTMSISRIYLNESLWWEDKFRLRIPDFVWHRILNWAWKLESEKMVEKNGQDKNWLTIPINILNWKVYLSSASLMGKIEISTFRNVY